MSNVSTSDRRLIEYSPADATIAKWSEDFLLLKIADLNDMTALRAVHDARMIVKNARVDVEKTRKALKQESLDWGRMIDAEAKRITALLEPIERHLTDEEGRVEAEKARIKQAKEDAARAVVQSRLDELMAFGCVIPWALANAMTPEQYAERLTEVTEAFVAKQAVEAERLRLQAIEDERRAAETKRLADERERLAKIANEQEEEANRLSAAKRRLEAEETAKSREVELEAARAEAAEKARIETEGRIKREAAEAEKKRQAKEAAAEAKRKRLEALRPDREKLLALAEAISAIELPQVSGEAATTLELASDHLGHATDILRGFGMSLTEGDSDA